jgi:hypothetical protein
VGSPAAARRSRRRCRWTSQCLASKETSYFAHEWRTQDPLHQRPSTAKGDSPSANVGERRPVGDNLRMIPVPGDPLTRGFQWSRFRSVRKPFLDFLKGHPHMTHFPSTTPDSFDGQALILPLPPARTKPLRAANGVCAAFPVPWKT